MLRLAANLGYLFAERPPIERFAAAAAAGFKAVELLFPYDQPPSDARREIERNRLTMLGINTPLAAGGAPGLAGVPGRETEFAAAFRQALDYAAAIGAASIHCMAGVVLPEQRAAGETTFVANMTRAADLAAEKRLTLLVEPLNRRDRPNYLIQRPEHAAELIARIGRPNVRIQFDFYHVQIEGGDLMTRFEHHLPLIGHVQIAAVPSRAEPDEGEVNYPAILAMLHRSTYAGYVSCEYKPRGRTEDGLSWAARYLGKP
jgi:hydroxypyruvate isomerase